MRTDDRGSLPLAMLAVLIASMLGALILPIVIQQNRASRFDVTRVHSLHAAQSGVDTMLGMIRAAKSTDSTGNVLGDPTKLPCYDSSSPLTGSANGTGAAAYAVSVAYYVSNPATGGSPMICSVGYGTYDPTTHAATPRYAVIRSTGTDGTVDSGSKGRTVLSTYVFQTDDTSSTGGQIRIFPPTDGTLQWCMDAGSSTPRAGVAIVLRACSNSSPPSAQQVFAYRSDLSIQLVSSVTSAQPTGLCIDTASTPHTDGLAMVLNACGVADPAKCSTITNCSPWNQQWSVDDNAHLRGANSDHSNTDNYCIQAPSQTDGVALTLQSCSGGTTDTRQTWVPAPTAGAGMAGAVNKQLVNYRQFATCLDVTGANPGAAFLILYSCKQNPDPTKVLWNQKFTPTPALGAAPTTTLLKADNGVTYCLISPLSAGGYVRLTAVCPASASVGNAATWTMYQTQDAGGSDLPYAQKYTIVDSSGLCLGPGPNSDLLDSTYLKAVVTRCDGSTGQKWNASASLDTSKMTNTHEVP